MTNLEDLIQSGYLEAFVLGALNNEELQMVSSWLIFPEVHKYINELQNLLEYYAGDNELSPSDSIGKIILRNSYG